MGKDYVPKYNQEQRRERRKGMAEAIRSGKTISEVCKEYETSPGTVVFACKENGVRNVNSRYEIRLPTYQIVASLQNTDKTLEEIATEFNLSKQRVGQILQQARKAGIKFPNRKQNRKVEK